MDHRRHPILCFFSHFFVKRKPKRKFFLFGAPVMIVLLYLCTHFNVYEYVMQEPFRNFQYPLEINMRIIVDKVLHNEYPGVQPINHMWYPSSFNNRHVCETSEGEYIFLLFMIKSSVPNFKLRQAIRQTWGKDDSTPNVKVRRLFLLGHNNSKPHLQEEIIKEQAIYKDIQQFLFKDSYFNNTIKTMMGFQWAATNCLNSQFVMFMDDDYYVNNTNLMKLLNSIEPYQRKDLIMSFVWNYVMPFRIKSSKWYMSLSEYPYRFWPPYPMGGAYIITPETLQKLYIVMQYTKYLRFDDVFVGIAAYKLGIPLVNVEEMHFYRNTDDKVVFQKAIAMHGFSDPQELIAVWKEQQEVAF